MTLQEKIDMLLDAFSQKVVNKYELLIELMTGIPRDEW